MQPKSPGGVNALLVQQIYLEEKKYQDALRAGAEFHVLKSIRQDITQLKAQLIEECEHERDAKDISLYTKPTYTVDELLSIIPNASVKQLGQILATLRSEVTHYNRSVFISMVVLINKRTVQLTQETLLATKDMCEEVMSKNLMGDIKRGESIPNNSSVQRNGTSMAE